jgi:hypothetical protein
VDTNQDQHQATGQPAPSGTAAGQRPATTTAGATVAGVSANQPREGATKAQSEIGPVTYGGANGPVLHGADDAETKAAYAAGHPAQARQPQAASQASGTSGTASPPQTRVRMTKDYAGHQAGSEASVDDQMRDAWVAAGVAEVVQE